MGRSRAKTSVFFLTRILPFPPGNATQESKDNKLENTLWTTYFAWWSKYMESQQ